MAGRAPVLRLANAGSRIKQFGPAGRPRDKAAMSQNVQVKTSNPQGLVVPRNPYSHLASVTGAQRLVTVSGQLGVNSQGRFAGDFAAQVRQALANVRTALAAEGLGVEHIMHLRHYVAVGQDLAFVNPERVAFLGEARPASTLIIVYGFAHPDALYEVEAMAAS